MITPHDEIRSRQTWEARAAYIDELEFVIRSLQLPGFAIESIPTDMEGLGYDGEH